MSNNDYGFFDRLLHYFALGFAPVQEMSFNIDQMFLKPDPEFATDKKHVFVAGLARAGTTALMRLFYETGQFTSLTYRDMPFPLAPYLWKKMFKFSSKKQVLGERAHGDGMLVGFDSPEALEEVFWRVFCAKQYIKSDRLIPMEADQEVINTFRKYISGLLQTNNTHKYLSKNNNNILRLKSIQKAFPDSIILIPFRDPLQQSLSLWNQHLKFVEEHRTHKFAKSYMQWLVHHEFGEDHRFFDVDSRQSLKTPDNPSYWLDNWINVYKYLLSLHRQYKKNIIFVSYEELCDHPNMVWESLSSISGIDSCNLPSGFELKKASYKCCENYDIDAEQEAKDIYEELKNQFEIDIGSLCKV